MNLIRTKHEPTGQWWVIDTDTNAVLGSGLAYHEACRLVYEKNKRKVPKIKGCVKVNYAFGEQEALEQIEYSKTLDELIQRMTERYTYGFYYTQAHSIPTGDIEAVAKAVWHNQTQHLKD